MLGSSKGMRMALELRPQGPDQKSAHTTLISMKNWRGLMCNTWPNVQNGRGVKGTDVLFYLDASRWRTKNRFNTKYKLAESTLCTSPALYAPPNDSKPRDFLLRFNGLYTLDYYSGYPANWLPRLPWFRISASVNRALSPLKMTGNFKRPNKNPVWEI